MCSVALPEDLPLSEQPGSFTSFLYDLKPVPAKPIGGLLAQHPSAGFSLPPCQPGLGCHWPARQAGTSPAHHWKTQEYLTEGLSHLYVKNATQCI